MGASLALWDKLRAAQKIKSPAMKAYKEAIEHANKGKMKEAEWWEKMGDMDMPVEKKPEEHATR